MASSRKSSRSKSPLNPPLTKGGGKIPPGPPLTKGGGEAGGLVARVAVQLKEIPLDKLLETRFEKLISYGKFKEVEQK